jgi:hypothetical protein
MAEASRRSGYMPLSGAASGRPLMINLVPRRGRRQILLATFRGQNPTFLQLMSPFHATRGRNLGLARLTRHGVPRYRDSRILMTTFRVTQRHRSDLPACGNFALNADSTRLASARLTRAVALRSRISACFLQRPGHAVGSGAKYLARYVTSAQNCRLPWLSRRRG